MAKRKRLDFTQRMWVRRFKWPRVHYAGQENGKEPWLFTDPKEAALDGKYGMEAVPVFVQIIELSPSDREP